MMATAFRVAEIATAEWWRIGSFWYGDAVRSWYTVPVRLHGGTCPRGRRADATVRPSLTFSTGGAL